MAFQQTTRSPVVLAGVGLHTGAPVQLRILPSEVDTGVRFRRVDLSPAVEIPARSHYVKDTTLATVLAKDGVEVSTVEHCLAALAGLGVDNAVVEVDRPELPILDGSALPLVEAIFEIGLKYQHRRRKLLRVEKPLRVEDGEKFCILRPATGFRVTYTIDFSGRFPGSQHFYLEVTPENFATDLSPARTFGFLEEVEYLRSVGKAKGGSLENALVLHRGKVLNPEGLRLRDEFVRHKIVDAMGDLALLGMPVLGHLIVHRGGHALHDALVRALLANPDAWSVVDPAEIPAEELVPPVQAYDPVVPALA
jgi:UDP-3-O-[3-hydroxymyristoyl] N-acetylglucosamine deacetylase